MQPTFSDPNDLPSVLKSLNDMIWWYENAITKADAYSILSRQPERPDQKHTPLEYAKMAQDMKVQIAKDLILIQRLCRHANNLITDELKVLAGEVSTKAKQLVDQQAGKAPPAFIKLPTLPYASN